MRLLPFARSKISSVKTHAKNLGRIDISSAVPGRKFRKKAMAAIGKLPIGMSVRCKSKKKIDVVKRIKN